MFPGQGSQEIGMGKDLFFDDPFTINLLELACDLVHEDLRQLCMEGPEERLVQARFLQPSIVTVCLGYWNRLMESGIKPDVVLGHSLGEISSLAASGVITAEQAITIAVKRGELMDRVASQCDGGMLAVMFMDRETVDGLIKEAADPDLLVLANDNAPDQFVLSGERSSLDNVAFLIAERKLGKSKKVPVAGPWHSPFLKEVRFEYEKWVEPFTFNPPEIDIILNATAKTENHPSTIKHLSSWQLTSPVFWRESMSTLKEMGVNVLVEIGPGKVLSGLARVNNFRKETRIFSVSKVEDINSLLKKTNQPETHTGMRIY
jgi:[acyl-carrier-protein] S-malonyltransferase